MTKEHSETQVAERIGRRRARLIPLMGILLIANQALFFGSDGGARGGSTGPALVQVIGWLGWAVLLLILLAGGGLFRNARVRALLNDETTRAHRSAAVATGYWAMAVSALAIYFLTLYEPVTGREALHIVLSCGIGAALIRFGILERRALADA